MQSQYTLERAVLLDEYHVEVIRKRFTGRLPVILPSVIDEVVVAVKEHIVAGENGAYYLGRCALVVLEKTDAITKLICRLVQHRDLSGTAESRCACQQPSVRWPPLM